MLSLSYNRTASISQRRYRFVYTKVRPGTLVAVDNKTLCATRLVNLLTCAKVVPPSTLLIQKSTAPFPLPIRICMGLEVTGHIVGRWRSSLPFFFIRRFTALLIELVWRGSSRTLSSNLICETGTSGHSSIFVAEVYFIVFL